MSKVLMMVLWDIDRTLLTSDGLGRRALSEACRAIFGDRFTLDGIDMLGRLDSAIWGDIARVNGLRDPDGMEERFRAIFSDCLKRQYDLRPTLYLLPGVGELIEALAADKHITQGILSGNYPEIGRFKLQRLGLDLARFPVCAWGSDGKRRRDLLPVALKRYLEATSYNIDASRVVIIGDTPRDIDCARANGCRCLSVATGKFSREALERAGAEFVLEDLTDTQRILDWIRS